MVLHFSSLPLHLQVEVTKKMEYKDFINFESSSYHSSSLSAEIRHKIWYFRTEETENKVKICENKRPLWIEEYSKKQDNTDFWTTVRTIYQQDVTIKTVDIERKNPRISAQDYSLVCEMPAGRFQKTCKGLAKFSDFIEIGATTEIAEIFFANVNVEDGRISMTSRFASINRPNHFVSVDVKEPVKVTFSCKVLNEFTKATFLSPRVCLYLNNNGPSVFEYPIEENGYMRFYLAPKIELNNANEF